MRIDAIQLYRVLLDGAPTNPAGKELIVVRLHSGPHVGWGDVALSIAPVDRDEWSTGAFSCLRDWLAPAVAGRTIATSETLAEQLNPFQGNRAAKCALDLAWWNLSAATRNQPLHRLIGGDDGRVPVCRSLGIGTSPDALFADIRAAFTAGYDHVLLKLGPGWNLEMLRAVRQAFPSEPIAVDCDGQCTLSQQDMFYRLEDFFLKYVEQPLEPDDLVGHAMLAENLRTPLALDQSVTSVARVEQALDLGCCKLMRLDLSRVGGLTPALAIHKACAAAEVRVMVGGDTLGYSSLRAATALAKLCEGTFQQPTDGDWVFEDKAQFSLSDNAWGGGWDADELDAMAVEHASL
jgi:O-succinylbenzoate synthase